jgi:hypothetical protein
MTPTYNEFQKDSRNRAVLKKSLKLRRVNSPVVASMKATKMTWTTGITKNSSRNKNINSITAACPGCFLNSLISTQPLSGGSSEHH